MFLNWNLGTGFSLAVVIASLIGGCGTCSGEDSEPARSHEPAASEGSTFGTAGEGSGAVGDPTAEQVGDSATTRAGSGSDRPADGLPAVIAPVPARAAAEIGTGGGTIVAGGLSFEVPPRALEEPQVVSVEILSSADATGRPVPGSLPLGAYRGEPWNPQLTRAARLVVPLSRAVEPGTDLELLAWHPQMRAFIVAGFGRAADDGTAAFDVRQLGEMIVRAAPVRSADAVETCSGANFSLRQAWPRPSEGDVVGLTASTDRTPRSLAFSLLTDYRLAPDFERVDFKNEEVVDSTAFRADERDHRDEDFLMDPNAAAALHALVALADREWLDPFTGEPAVRIRVTEAYDSLIEHSAESTHYQGRALDLTTSPVPPADGAARREWYGRLARLAVCAGFDWVLFENQAHVHASVRPTQIAFAAVDGSQLRVSTADLRRPRRVRGTGQQWSDDPSGDVDFRWSSGGRFELSARREGSGELSPPQPTASLASTTTVDGMRRIVVTDGRAYLVNTVPLPPLGSVDADGTPVDVEYPLPVSPAGAYVRSASFREHENTRDAYEHHVLGGH